MKHQLFETHPKGRTKIDLDLSDRRFDTIAVRGSYGQREAAENRGAICEPAFLSPAQHFASSDQMEACLGGRADGWIYSRIDNPNVAQLEDVVAALECYGSSVVAECAAFSSGMAATCMAATALVAGHGATTKTNIVLPASCYGGTLMLFQNRFASERGITLRWVKNSLDLAAWDAVIDENTRLVFCEVPSNPLLDMTDIPALAALAHEAGVPLMVDATLSSPALLRPLTKGADIVVQSATKVMSASGLSVAGTVTARRNICAKNLPPEVTRNFAAYLRDGPRRDMGSILSPMSSLFSLSDLRSLRSRVAQMSASALKIARVLNDHPLVQQVHYPGLGSDPGHSVACRDMRLVDSEYDPGGMINAFGHLLSVRLEGGAPRARRFLDALTLFWRANDLGRIKSTATIPAISTHALVKKDTRGSARIDDGLVRLSVGCENGEDLLRDITAALHLTKAIA